MPAELHCQLNGERPGQGEETWGKKERDLENERAFT